MGKVIYYRTLSGENPVRDFITTLSPSQKAKIVRILTYVEEYGLITVIRHVKKLTDTPLWEIRILGQDNIRVLYATIERDAILVLHGFIKKSQKTPAREIASALDRLHEWITRKKELAK